MIKTCPETLRWIVYEIIAILGFYGNVLWGTLWHHIRRWKPFFQTHHTYMCDTSLEAFQALFKTGFRLKIFPLEVVFFFSILKCACMRYLAAEYCWLIFWKIGLTAIKNTIPMCILHVYQSNSYFKLYPELFSNGKYSYNNYLFLFFVSIFWMLVKAQICPQVSQTWVMMKMYLVKTITHYNYASLEDLLSK